MPTGPEKSLRADARRNHGRILQAAQALFASHGAAIPMQEIAKRAGCGVGTLYRHFPTKAALLEALIGARLAEVVAAAEELEHAADPAHAMFTFLRRLIEETKVKKHLHDALSGTGFDWKRAAGELDVRAPLERLLKRAQRAKQIRRDLNISELLALLAGTLHALDRVEHDTRARERIFNVLCDGLRGTQR
jgi:AcrR family transcriptional regulator